MLSGVFYDTGYWFYDSGFWFYICLISELVRFHFGYISAPNQVEPKALVLEPKLTGTLIVQNLRCQNTKVVVLSVFLFNNRSASYTLHHLNRVKLFMENSAMARLRDILEGWGPVDPSNKLKQDSLQYLSQSFGILGFRPIICLSNRHTASSSGGLHEQDNVVSACTVCLKYLIIIFQSGPSQRIQ